MTLGQLMALARTAFPTGVNRNCSIVKVLVKRWGLEETEAMVKGAQLLGWDSLIALNAREGVGRRLARSAYWARENSRKHVPQSLGQILKRALEEAS